MDFADEHYVKLFTRDTVTWRSWPWQARALLPLLMRVVDHAGILRTGHRELGRSVALMVDVPIDVAAPGIEALLADGTVEKVAEGIIITKFVEAQESRKTDAQSKRDQREKAKALARAAQVPVSPTSPVRTTSDDVRRSPPPALLCPTPALPEKKETGPTLFETSVFAHWQRVMDSPRSKYTKDRQRKVSARLAEGYSVDDLKQAIDGCSKTPHNMGATDGQLWNDLELICRDGAQVERFMRNATSPPAGKGPKPNDDIVRRPAAECAVCGAGAIGRYANVDVCGVHLPDAEAEAERLSPSEPWSADLQMWAAAQMESRVA